ncbi:hypothetical protein CYLTODRAFT_494776 [Cylindrobasidium torrendii FP15055 ss-10]|uniref:Uncharacterized protein n=1 Tax=Cylindrobasidium torrendii FP15055 ss-10 TaxID=1314674 RepID=A0A0D7AW90_9AGAR|nr:hypothetical protein CYLTODRAFT_494776 [Cylindrobasidium torrendii FP15055 ss-10]
MKNPGYRLSRTWQHKDSVHCITISPDGRYLACSSNDYKLSIYDLSIGMLLREYTVTDHAVALTWGETSNQLYVVCLKGEVLLYHGVARSKFVAFIYWLLRLKTITELANLRSIVRDAAYDPVAQRLFVSVA